MGRNPKLNEIMQWLSSGENFDLTDAQYERITGVPLPKDKNYLKKRSALANAATQEGYRLEVVEKMVRFIKTQGKKGTRVTQQEKEMMWQLYNQLGSCTKVVKKLNRSPDTVSHYAHEFEAAVGVARVVISTKKL